MLNENENCVCICLSEHWKSMDQLKAHNFTNFNLSSQYCRPQKLHGGVAIYTKQNFRCKERKDICNKAVIQLCECAAVELNINSRRFIIICIYKPPQANPGEFLTILEEMIEPICAENCDIFVVGDFNIDCSVNSATKLKFVSLLESFNQKQTIFQCTRVSDHSKTLLDNIFTNVECIKSQTINYHVSDHLGQIVSFLVDKQINNFSLKRNFSMGNKLNFANRLREVDWSSVYSIAREDVDEQWSAFVNMFMPLFNFCFPKKVVREWGSNSHITCPELIECKNRLNILYTMKVNDHRFREEYKKVKLEYNNILKNIEKLHNSNKIAKSENKSKCVWNIINKTRGSNVTNDIEIINNPKQKANEINCHFKNMAVKLLNNSESIQFSCDIPINNLSIFIEPVSAHEIVNMLRNFKNKLSSGLDDIPISILKFVSIELCDVLAFIVNNSCMYGVFPHFLKTALIKPVYKKGDPNLIENFRPISLLSSFSKLFETAMNDRILSFFKYCSLFSDCQHGFRKERSTNSAVFNFINKLLKNLDEKKLNLGIFLDLSKAYDTINYDILYEKLDRYGIRGNALKWVKSYLSLRSQRVAVIKNRNTFLSDVEDVETGIPQGSVVGPLLFIIYINDIQNAVGCEIVTYADDTNLLVNANSTEALIHQAKNHFNTIKNWFSKNRMILNMEKTNLIFFKTSHSKIVSPLEFDVGDIKISCSQNTRFLGVFVDENLNWKTHVNHLTKKLNTVQYSLRVLKPVVNVDVLFLVYQSNFQSVLRYCITMWGQCSDIDELFIIQKRAIRTILGLGYTESCRGHFKANNILTVYGLYVYEVLVFVFKNFNMFIPLASQSTRNQFLHYPYHKTTILEKGCFYTGVKYFNKLPTKIKKCNNLTSFKAQTMELLINIEPYSYTECIF